MGPRQKQQTESPKKLREKDSFPGRGQASTVTVSPRRVWLVPLDRARHQPDLHHGHRQQRWAVHVPRPGSMAGAAQVGQQPRPRVCRPDHWPMCVTPGAAPSAARDPGQRVLIWPGPWLTVTASVSSVSRSHPALSVLFRRGATSRGPSTGGD